MTHVRAIRVPLTESQREMIRQATGEDVHEAIVAAPTDSEMPLESEAVLGAGAQILWDGTASFLRNLGCYPTIQAGYEEYIEHPVDPNEPAIAVLR